MKRLLLPLCGVMLAMGSCTDGDPIDTSSSAQDIAIEVVASGISAANIAANDRVGLYFGEYENVEYTISTDGTLTPVGEEIILTTTSLQSLYAYYPYDADRSSSVLDFDLSDQQSVEPLYWSVAKSANSLFELSFGSIYATVSLSVSNVTDDSTICTVSGAPIIGSFDISTGELMSVSTTECEVDLDIEYGAAEIALAVMPCTDLSQVKFAFEGDTQDPFYYYPSIIDSEWLSGSVYGYEVPLQASYNAVKSVSIDQSTLSLVEAESDPVLLVATITAEDPLSQPTNSAVKWSSSNSSVAFVTSNGEVTAVGAGEATITVTTVCGAKTAACVVSVEAYTETFAKSMKIDDDFSIERGVAHQFTATILPEETHNKAVSWSSSNTSVATIDSNGWLAARTEGETIITARSSSNKEVIETCTVTVSGGSAIAIGDYIYETGGKYLYSSEYDADTEIVGVVYTTTGDLSGMVVHLTGSSTTLLWTSSTDYNVLIASDDNSVADYTSTDNSLSNMKAIYDNDDTNHFANYPAFSYVHALNDSDETYSGDGVGVWIIASEGNMKDETGIGLMKNVFSNGYDGESLINEQIDTAGGTKIFAGTDYLCSTEVSGNSAKYRAVKYKTDGTTTPVGNGFAKATEAKYVRPVMAFDLN